MQGICYLRGGKTFADLWKSSETDKLKKEIGRLKQTAREKEAWSRNLEATKSRKNAV